MSRGSHLRLGRQNKWAPLAYLAFGMDWFIRYYSQNQEDYCIPVLRR